MASSKWPVDTALTLSRDHITELRQSIQYTYDNEARIPTDVILPFLDNIDTLHNILSRHNVEYTRDSRHIAQDTGFKIRGCARRAASSKRQALAHPGFDGKSEDEDWEDEEDEPDIKDEVSSEDDSKNTIGPFQPPRLGPVRRREKGPFQPPRLGTVHRREKGFNNRNPLVVTIKVMEPDWQSEVLRLGQARVADMVSDDMLLQGLGPGSFSIRILPSGHIRLMLRTPRRARELRDRQLFKPLSFGKYCYVQRFRH
ncbi:MAG: hypothetical protein Q9168_005717 [Polycauliona sp. 1 TL-2023]